MYSRVYAYWAWTPRAARSHAQVTTCTCVSKRGVQKKVELIVLAIRLRIPLYQCVVLVLPQQSNQKWVFRVSANRTYLEKMFFKWFSSIWTLKIYSSVKLCAVNGVTFFWLGHRGEDFTIEILGVYVYGGRLRRNWSWIRRHCEPSSTEASAKTYFKKSTEIDGEGISRNWLAQCLPVVQLVFL